MAATAYHLLAILICGTCLHSGIADARIVVFNAYNETVDEFSDIEVPYGSDLLETLKGMVVLANPFDACTPIQDAYNSSVYASFVLMFGNVSIDCPGHLKVLNAQRAGFDAAILFGGMLPFGQVSLSSEPVIPALIVEYKAGLRIKNNYIFKNKNGSAYYWMKLIPNSQDISYYIMLFSIVIGICFMIMLLFIICLLVKCVRERRRNRRNRLSSRQIRQLGTERFTAGAQYDVCAICLEDYREGEKLRILPCQHVYHIRCIDPWLMNNRRNCPLCKRRIRFGDSDSSSSIDSDASSLNTNEESPLIPPPPPLHPLLRTSASDSSLLVQRVSGGFAQLLSETTRHCHNAAGDGGQTNLVAEAQGNNEVSDSHPSTYGSVNNSEGDEFVDALTPGETSTSSAVHA